MSLEDGFDVTFAAGLALREKQIQQSYRPLIGIHKWFARRPGTLFRNLLLAEFNGAESLNDGYWRGHQFKGVIADPFMGGGTPLIEANRLGFHVIGADINPMAYWIVRQSLAEVDLNLMSSEANRVCADVEHDLGQLYRTECKGCGGSVPVKYFLWVKQQACPDCGDLNDLFPGHLLAEATRHPRHVLVCSGCAELVELDQQPTASAPATCPTCHSDIVTAGPARRNRCVCRSCLREFRYPTKDQVRPLEHRMWAIEYHCSACRQVGAGRLFKRPDEADLTRVRRSVADLEVRRDNLPIPDVEIPPGDETERLHRWGYRRYSEMFTSRHLLGLGTLLKRIMLVSNEPVRDALLTVFSDSMRYQNLLCRYDTYALKCQDVFSVHGFPVGLVQCENVLLGTPGVGSGAFRHFVEKYTRAKQYCTAPFEVATGPGRKTILPVENENISAELTTSSPGGRRRQARLCASSAEAVPLDPGSLDGVFTDPPYFDNVQYAELMDFCYVWLRQALPNIAAFNGPTTRAAAELTGNVTEGRDLRHFTNGLSQVFQHYAAALKPSAPFVFTYHHNDLAAYAPLVVAMLDSHLLTTAVLVAPAEMEASLHIARTGSSIIDSIFVSRRGRIADPLAAARRVRSGLRKDCLALAAGGVRMNPGDIRCILLGRVAHVAIQRLAGEWRATASIESRLALAERGLLQAAKEFPLERISRDVFRDLAAGSHELGLRVGKGRAVAEVV